MNMTISVIAVFQAGGACWFSWVYISSNHRDTTGICQDPQTDTTDLAVPRTLYSKGFTCIYFLLSFGKTFKILTGL